jgi:hypothetical protein
VTAPPGPFERVTFLDEAIEDLKAVASRSQGVLTEVFRLLKRLDAGTLEPLPLRDFAKTGDLSDCGKIVVALPDEPEYRIVVKGQDGRFTVCEVIAVEDRTHDLPYLLAGLRLGRIEDAVRRSDAGRRVHRIRQILDQ